MCIALVGGMDRLEKHYFNLERRYDVNFKVIPKSIKDITRRIGRINAVIIFTNKISHPVKNIMLNFARSKEIPCLMCHSCGISTLEKSIKYIKRTKQEEELE